MRECPLAQMFFICSDELMNQPAELAIASIILNAPGWARVGITVPDKRLRGEAAIELAREIVDKFDDPLPEPFDPNQLRLAL